MRDKNQLQYPYRGLPRDMPVRRISPIEITEKMQQRHVHPRHKRHAA